MKKTIDDLLESIKSEDFIPTVEEKATPVPPTFLEVDKETGHIKYTGGSEGETISVIEFHKWLQAQADDALESKEEINNLFYSKNDKND